MASIVLSETTLDSADWTTLPSLAGIEGVYKVLVKERTGTEDIDIHLATDGTPNYGNTFRIACGDPLYIEVGKEEADMPDKYPLPNDVFGQAKRVSSNTVYVQVVAYHK